MRVETINLSDILDAVVAGNRQQDEDRMPPNPDIDARVLKDAYQDWIKPCPFKVGDLIVSTGKGMWKETLGVAIVARVLDKVRLEISDESHRVFAYDMTILVKHPLSNGKIGEIAVQSRDFTAYTGRVA